MYTGNGARWLVAALKNYFDCHARSDHQVCAYWISCGNFDRLARRVVKGLAGLGGSTCSSMGCGQGWTASCSGTAPGVWAAQSIIHNAHISGGGPPGLYEMVGCEEGGCSCNAIGDETCWAGERLRKQSVRWRLKRELHWKVGYFCEATAPLDQRCYERCQTLISLGRIHAVCLVPFYVIFNCSLTVPYGTRCVSG